MAHIDNLLEFGSLHTEYNAQQLRDGQGFVSSGTHMPTAAINTQYPANFIALLEFQESQPRGNHYHLEKTEVIIVLKGKIQGEFRLPEDDKVQISRVLGVGEFVRIAPGCVHTFTALQGSAMAIEYGSTTYTQTDVIESTLKGI